MADQKKKLVSPQEPTGSVPVPIATGGSPSASASDKIGFYCPNGHRVSAPAKLAGKDGKCSKCNESFVVPRVSEPMRPSGDSKSLQQSAQPPALQSAEFKFLKEDLTQGAVDPEVFPNDFLTQTEPPSAKSVEESSAHVTTLASTQPEAFVEVISNPTALLLARLWDEREHGGVVEIHLTGGSVIAPEGFDEQWSRGTHGLFANRTADDKVTLTAVAWDSVQKIIVRQVEGLPDGMFPGMDPQDEPPVEKATTD